MDTLSKEILNHAKLKFEQLNKLDNTTHTIEFPIGKIVLDNGQEAQVEIRVTTEISNFKYCDHFFTKK